MAESEQYEQQMEEVEEISTQGEEQQDSQPLSQQQSQQSTATAPPSQQNRKTNRKQPEYPCVACGKNVTSNSVQCTLCTMWSHKACTNLSTEAFKGLEAQVREVGVAYWACRACLSFANKVNRQLQAAAKRQDEVEAKVDENCKATEPNTQEINKLRQELDKVKQALDQERGDRNAMLSEELRDRELRRNNIVIHGLPEPNENTSYSRARMEQDRAVCGNLFSTMGIRTRQEDLRFCRRVGERGQDPRPITIGLRTEEEKRAILERARLLRGTSYDNVSIVPDMTKMQRQAEDNLTREAEARNGQLTAEDREKNLKWLVVGKRGEKRLIKATEREGQNNIRREARLGDYIPGSVQQGITNLTTNRGGYHGERNRGGGGFGGGGYQSNPNRPLSSTQPAVPLPAGRGATSTNGSSGHYGPRGSGMGGGVGGGMGGGGQRTYELGARRRDTYPGNILAPELLTPVNNINANYTPIQHRQIYNGDGGGSSIGGKECRPMEW
jgi:hypothetical protein